VQFWPKEDLSLGLYYSDGTSDAEGRFRLKGRDGPEVKPGRYVVLIKRLVRKDGTPPTAEDLQKADPMTQWRNSLPDLYSERDRTPHVVDVQPGRNDFPLELKSKP
jgi:hypothetical protein